MVSDRTNIWFYTIVIFFTDKIEMVVMAVEYGNRIWQIEFLRNRTKIYKKFA